MEDLKIRVFRTIEKEIELQDFEKWLYVQNDLSERMDEGLILELFSFNYNQRGASFGFDRKFINYFDKKEFTNWKILANLKTLQNGCEEPERILCDFYDLSNGDYPYLSSLGYNQFELEDCEYYGWSRKERLKAIQKEADELLSEIEEWSASAQEVDLKDFEPKTKKLDMLRFSSPESSATEPINKKWWEIWK